MGDRANVVVVDQGGRVFFYTHWHGSELPEIVRRALARQQRWNDPSYLARIIFCEMVKGDEASATGFGISARIGDNSYSVLVVNCDECTVGLETEDGTPVAGVGTFSYDEYVALGEATWSKLESNKKKAA